MERTTVVPAISDLDGFFIACSRPKGTSEFEEENYL